MRYAAPLAIAATALAAALTVVAVRSLGAGVEAHPITRLAVAHVGWVGYVTLSIAAIAIGLRLLALLPVAKWSVRAVALAKVADASRDAWLVARHPAVGADAAIEVLPALVAIVAVALAGLLILYAPEPSRPRSDPELAI